MFDSDAELVAVKARAILRDCARFASVVPLDDFPQAGQQLAYSLTGMMRTAAQDVLEGLAEGEPPDELDEMLDTVLAAVEAANESLRQSIDEALTGGAG